jgi:TolB-like protein
MELLIDKNIIDRRGLTACFYLFFLVVSFSGCGEIKHYVRPDTDFARINKIAVLPFENYTQDSFSDDKIKSLVVIDLLSRGVNVIEPGEVMNTLRELRVRSIDSITSENIKEIGELLDVPVVMTGSVGVFKVNKGVSVSYPEVSISLTIHEAATGDIIWSAWHTTGGASFLTRHFGSEGATLDETAKILINDTIDTIY